MRAIDQQILKPVILSLLSLGTRSFHLATAILTSAIQQVVNCIFNLGNVSEDDIQRWPPLLRERTFYANAPAR
jgi:hypothetical protein